MNHITIRFRQLFSLGMILALLLLPLHSFAANDALEVSEKQTINYIALGDSLAAGVSPDNELGSGYADMIADNLSTLGVLGTFNKGFSYPGYTTANVLEDLKGNVVKDVYGIGYDAETAEIQQSIQEANLITYSAGANDVLKFLEVDPDTGEVSIDEAGIIGAIKQVGINVQETMAFIHTLNPDTSIYVMGYYNPFPHFDAKLQPQLELLLTLLNKAIEDGISGTQAKFVAIGDVIAEDYTSYLPNPINIHLSEAGYAAVKEQFLSYIGLDFDIDVEQSVDPSEEFVFTDIAKHWAKAYINLAVERGFVSGYPDGTFLPDDSLTRAQFTVMLIKALKPEQAEKSLTFTDEATIATWAINEVHTAVGLGIVNGYADGSFQPNAKITRAEIAVMIAKALGLDSEATATTSFADDGQIPKWARSAVEAVKQLGVVEGRDDNVFAPLDPATRAEGALMLLRVLDL